MNLLLFIAFLAVGLGAFALGWLFGHWRSAKALGTVIDVSKLAYNADARVAYWHGYRDAVSDELLLKKKATNL